MNGSMIFIDKMELLPDLKNVDKMAPLLGLKTVG